MPYKDKQKQREAVRIASRRYRQQQKQKQFTIQQYIKSINHDFYNKMYGKSRPQRRRKK